MAAMRNLQPIVHHGQLAAVVIGGLAIIDDTLTDRAHRHVQAMCLYALELEDREGAGAYSDADADAYARAAPAHA